MKGENTVMDKKVYADPKAEKLEFDYDEVVRTSAGGAKNPAQCAPTTPGLCSTGSNPGHGCYVESNAPGNCSYPIERKQPHQCF